MFNIDAPIFAFSHCRDVVEEVSKAGALGVLGATNPGNWRSSFPGSTNSGHRNAPIGLMVVIW
jgi:hypothetical protein